MEPMIFVSLAYSETGLSLTERLQVSNLMIFFIIAIFSGCTLYFAIKKQKQDLWQLRYNLYKKLHFYWGYGQYNYFTHQVSKAMKNNQERRKQITSEGQLEKVNKINDELIREAYIINGHVDYLKKNFDKLKNARIFWVKEKEKRFPLDIKNHDNSLNLIIECYFLFGDEITECINYFHKHNVIGWEESDPKSETFICGKEIENARTINSGNHIDNFSLKFDKYLKL